MRYKAATSHSATGVSTPWKVEGKEGRIKESSRTSGQWRVGINSNCGKMRALGKRVIGGREGEEQG